ncbi:methylmalonyl Co-A mutase-associated GTPase MeaB [Desulfolithobacter sp.]
MSTSLASRLHRGDPRAVGRAISLVENHDPAGHELLASLDRERIDQCLVLGVTGPPGAGKSTLTGQLIRCIRERKMRVGVIAVDPSSPISGGALLGDRIRMMEHALDRDVVVRSMATRGRLGGLCGAAGAAVRIMAASGCRIVIIETVGIGQSEMDIVSLADLTLMVLAPGFGDDIQAMKAGILEVADLLVVNKSDQPGARKLFLDMTTVLRDPEEREQRIIETVASEGRGMAELLERVLTLEEARRSQGLFQRRRDESFVTETLDWALELLAQPLRERIRRTASTETDPRLAAEHLLRDILK